MKKWIPFIFYGLFFCISVFCFIKYDSKRFDYGWKCDFCNKKLPYNLVHKFYDDYPQNFVLFDEDDFELVGIGFKYYASNFKIKDFLAYGYNDTSVVVKFTDSLNTIRYLTSYETKYKSKKGNPEISFKDLSNSDFEKVKDKYNWIVFSHEEAQKVTFKRFLSFIGTLLSLVFIVWRLFKLRSNKATD
ncbi:MAG: hypothetical protein IPJ64_00505 [Saprospiraceae bacterium]|nr:hypothetical protein [Saprospiraceae bacterium]MBK7794849.1 hypothetical protein [Saprospiraceae bacterium]